ncbi:flagellar biosynthesis anti-sigma factor FlgM [Shewanella surugensis]|uniref:Negative regulator of flagellin synthesis n=1 Tax=Shewanella surugensis TaxID=212020 RepID=A0ABT0LC73_9GAMM|nr:flagellar biosynthesis anti-sigma factor FlgM [Shewanella surugensis]MCL1124791.1 flagellar biosynthesis anti-sigma factor FlgM [Shewanella surugensis]
MEINKINSALNAEVGASMSQTSTKAEPQPAQSQVKPIATPKAVSDDWELLARSQPQLQQIDDVDQAKVDQLRQSLKDGTFDLNLGKVAEAMFNQHG